MRQITVQRRIEQPRAAVWAVLADFPNIATWNTGVKKSYATSDATGGVGATRHCDLAPVGELEETILEWQPDERLVISIDAAAKLPIRSGEVTFTLDGADDATTTTTLEYAYQPKGGPLGRLFGPVIDRQLRSGFTGFLADLDAAASA